MANIVGGYGQPLIMGLTPWTQSRLAANRIGASWPPLVDADRLAQYEEFVALVENRAQDVFDRLQLQADQKTKIALVVALPELLCSVWADSVWSDPPSIELPSTTSEDAWQAVDEANQYTEVRGWESVFSAAMRGTSVLRLFRSEELGALTGDPVQIEEVSAAIFFPKLRAGSDRLIEYVVLAWEENRAEGDEQDRIWHVRQIHQIENGRYTIATEERRAKETTFRRVKFEQTDLDFLPFVDMHALRWSGRYWGMSELTRSMTLFDDIDNTLSNIAEILEYHGKPVLQVPLSSLNGGVFQKGADRTLGIRNPDDKDIARYVTYDGQLAAQLQDLDKVLELIFLTNEVPRTYFGLGLEGGAPSGTSLRLQLQNYLKKAGRWQGRETMRAKTVIDYALRLKGISDPAQRLVKVTHGSPLPADDAQEATTEAGLYTAGLSSRRLAIKRLRRVPEEDLDEELQEIETEKADSVASAQDAFSGNQPPTPTDNPAPAPAGRGGAFRKGTGGSSAARQR